MCSFLFVYVSPLTDLSQSTLLDSTRSGSVMVLPGRIFLKKAKSSTDTLEKGRLSGAAAGAGLTPSVSSCNLRENTTNCAEPQMKGGLWKSTGTSRTVDEAVFWMHERLGALLSLDVLWKTFNMTGVKR